MAQRPRTKNTQILTQSRQMLAASSLRILISGWEIADGHIERVAGQWRNLDHAERVEVGRLSPGLADALIGLEDHDTKRIEGGDPL